MTQGWLALPPHWRFVPWHGRGRSCRHHCQTRTLSPSPSLSHVRGKPAFAAPGAGPLAQRRFPGTSGGQRVRRPRVLPSCPAHSGTRNGDDGERELFALAGGPSGVAGRTYHVVKLLYIDTVGSHRRQHACTHVLYDGLCQAPQVFSAGDTTTPGTQPQSRTESTMPPMSAPEAGALDAADEEDSALSTPLLNVPNRFWGREGGGVGPHAAGAARQTSLPNPGVGPSQGWPVTGLHSRPGAGQAQRPRTLATSAPRLRRLPLHICSTRTRSGFPSVFLQFCGSTGT